MTIPQAFAKPTEIRTFASGAPIFKAGDEAVEMFMIESGEVDIVIGGEVVETVGPEGFFGEMSLIDDSPRSADAIARSDCRLLIVKRHQFLFMVDEMPLFALKVMRGMADRLRRTARPAPVPA